MIPNETTLIIIADRGVFSAGEGLLSFVFRQVENVVIVGENSGGAVTFGQVSTHQLPHSNLRVTLPIKLNAMVDLEWREERGYYPDLWVPPVDALNYAVAAARKGTITTQKVAAARKGTITTQKELPEGYFEAAFVPERLM
jgi:C-terminal processing protease CtpA/Prc